MKNALAAGVFAAAAAIVTAPAWSTTITFNPLSQYDALLGDGPQVVETFDDLPFTPIEGEVVGDFETRVGTFNTLGGTGTGGTVSRLPGNSGTRLALREGNTFGRVNTTPGGNWYLDSNDTWGMAWEVETGSMFDRIVFTLADGSDQGAWLSILTDGERAEQRTTRRLTNGSVYTVVIDFGEMVSSALIEIGNYTASGGSTYRENDGFSIDDISVNIAPVPVPAGLPLLLAGLGGFAYLRRRHQAKTA